jgi:osmotically-inducible protein OsmY
MVTPLEKARGGVRAVVVGLWRACLSRGLLSLLLLSGIGILRVSAAESDMRDLQHEVAVRAALAKDTRLGALNIMVRVQDRVATLSGLVPSRELAKRALETAAKVQEVKEVRDRLTVQFEDKTLALPLPSVGPQMMPPGAGKSSPSEPPASANIIQAGKTSMQPMGKWIPINPMPATAPSMPPSVELLPWKVGTQPGEPVSRPKEQTPGKTPSADAAAIASAVQSLVQADERFRRLRFEVKDGKVLLSGVVYRWADLQELARAVTRIPGVDAVVLREIKTEPRN